MIAIQPIEENTFLLYLFGFEEVEFSASSCRLRLLTVMDVPRTFLAECQTSCWPEMLMQSIEDTGPQYIHNNAYREIPGTIWVRRMAQKLKVYIQNKCSTEVR